MTDTPLSPNNPIHPTPSTVNHHTQERHKRLIAFVNGIFKGQAYRIDSLLGDASFRRYHRIVLENPKPDQHPVYMLMDAPPQLESIESFVKVAELMADKINVPTLYAKDLSQGFLLLQDFGEVEFAHLIADANAQNEEAKINALYQSAINSLLDLQRLSVDVAKQKFNLPDYDSALLEREMRLFTDWFLPYIEAQLTQEQQQLWQEFMQQLISQVLQQPQVVVHRDYHSRNLMQDQYDSERLGIIDFQDAVIGAYTYDLVSLVRDAYVDWSEAQINEWIAYYWRLLNEQNAQVLDESVTQSFTAPKSNDKDGIAADIDQFVTQLNLMGVQRHLKVLGIFVRLAQRDGKQRYLADIPKVWRDLMIEMRSLCESSDANIRDTVAPIYQWLSEDIQPKVRKAFG